jgi:hypothetical protein
MADEKETKPPAEEQSQETQEARAEEQATSAIDAAIQEPAAPEDGAQSDTERLAAELDAATARAEAAEARAKEAEERHRQAGVHLREADKLIRENKLSTINQAIESAKGLEDQLKAQLRQAKTAGDIDAEVELAARMSRNYSELQILHSGKMQLEAQPALPPEPVYNADALIEGARLSAASAAWLRAHPDWASSQAKVTKLTGAHNLAVGDGIALDTPEYFAHVERTLGIGNNDQRPPEQARTPINPPAPAASQAAQVVQRRTAPPAAPPSRGDGGGRILRLTAAQREAAKISGVSDEEYAKNIRKN